MSGQHIAVLTTINEATPAGSVDTFTVYGPGGEEIEAVEVASSEDEAPYREALAKAGWRVTGTTGERTGANGGDAWTVEPA